MKENYNSKQDRQIVKLARRYKVSPADVMIYLDRLHDNNFETDIKEVEEQIVDDILQYALNDKTGR